jgi:hypothetical protein
VDCKIKGDIMPDLPDPSTLTDEELDKILAGEEPEEILEEEVEDEDDKKPDTDGDKPKDEPKDDDKKEDLKDEPVKPEDKPEDKPDDKPTEDDKKPSRREQMRIRDILNKYGEPSKPAEKPKVEDALDYEKSLEADAETIKKLQDDRQKVSDQSYDRGLEQAKSIQFMTRLEIDAPRVEAKYPQLDKNSDDFKPDAANDVNMLYLALSGFDPETKQVQNADVRYSNFVDTIFTLVEDLATQKAQEVTKHIKSQAAKTGLRPDGSSSKKLNLNKAPEQMTDEELDAYLDQAIPKR